MVNGQQTSSFLEVGSLITKQNKNPSEEYRMPHDFK